GFGAGHDWNHGPGHGQGQNHGHGQNHGRGQGGSPNAPPRPGGDPEARTLLETEWAPPPSQPGPVSRTPPPWEQPRQYSNWQQPPPPPAHGLPDDRVERRRTVVVVTIAVILVVAAVLAGAFILRGKVQGDAAALPAAVPAAAAP